MLRRFHTCVKFDFLLTCTESAFTRHVFHRLILERGGNWLSRESALGMWETVPNRWRLTQPALLWQRGYHVRAIVESFNFDSLCRNRGIRDRRSFSLHAHSYRGIRS
jgi:hypothetical protein